MTNNDLILGHIYKLFPKVISNIVISYGYYLNFELSDIIIEHHTKIELIFQLSNGTIIIFDKKGFKIWDINNKLCIKEKELPYSKYINLISNDNILIVTFRELIIYNLIDDKYQKLDINLFSYRILNDGNIIALSRKKELLMISTQSLQYNSFGFINDFVYLFRQLPNGNIMMIKSESYQRSIYVFNLNSGKLNYIFHINLCKILELNRGRILKIKIMPNNNIVFIFEGYKDSFYIKRYIIIIDQNGLVINKKKFNVGKNKFIVSIFTEINKIIITFDGKYEIYNLETLNFETSHVLKISSENTECLLLPDSRFLFYSSNSYKIQIYDPFTQNDIIHNFPNILGDRIQKYIILKDSKFLSIDFDNGRIRLLN